MTAGFTCIATPIFVTSSRMHNPRDCEFRYSNQVWRRLTDLECTDDTIGTRYLNENIGPSRTFWRVPRNGEAVCLLSTSMYYWCIAVNEDDRRISPTARQIQSSQIAVEREENLALKAILLEVSLAVYGRLEKEKCKGEILYYPSQTNILDTNGSQVTDHRRFVSHYQFSSCTRCRLPQLPIVTIGSIPVRGTGYEAPAMHDRPARRPKFSLHNHNRERSRSGMFALETCKTTILEQIGTTKLMVPPSFFGRWPGQRRSELLNAILGKSRADRPDRDPGENSGNVIGNKSVTLDLYVSMDDVQFYRWASTHEPSTEFLVNTYLRRVTVCWCLRSLGLYPIHPSRHSSVLNQYRKENNVVLVRSSSNRSTNAVLRYELVYYRCSSSTLITDCPVRSCLRRQRDHLGVTHYVLERNHKLSNFLYDGLLVNRQLTEEELGTCKALLKYGTPSCKARQFVADDFGKNSGYIQLPPEVLTGSVELLCRTPAKQLILKPMSVSHKDLQVLSNLLLPERVGQQNLESISTLVQNQFGKTDHFKICRVLMFLLHHDFLYDAQSRFTALYIIWDMYKSDPRYLNPFLGFLVSYLQDETISKLPLSAVLVFHTILSQPDQIHEFLKYTPMEILNLRVNNTSRKPDWSALQTELQALNEKLPKVASCGIPCVVPDKDVPSSFYSEESVPIQLRRHCLDSLLSRTEPFSCQDGLRPEFIRVAPPLLPCPQGNGIPRILSKDDVAEDSCSSADNRTVEERQTNVFSGWHEELIWLNPPTIVHDFHWDVGDEQATPITELRTLLNKAMNSTLQQSDQQTIVQMISENPNLVHSLGINVENLPNLVNRNPVIAIEILAVLVDSPKAE
ncbi:hypothetical protein CLF_108933, partial [Clonorchis sinensis]